MAQAIDARHAHEQDHDHQHGEGMHCCAHHELELERWMVVYLLGGVMVGITFLAKQFNLLAADVAEIPAFIGAVALSIPLFWAAWTELRRMQPSSSTLVALAILAAFASGKYTEAGFLAFILLIADQFLRRTATGAQRAIEELIGLTPDTARLLGEDGVEREIALEDVEVGMTLRVRPGENLPVDGKVVSGRSTINQASLTGEPLPVEAEQGTLVYAGTTNLTGALDVIATQVGEDTTIGKVTQLIRAAESSRSPRQLIIEQVARFFVPVALTIALVVWFVLSQNPATRDEAALRAVSVLVVACPAALLLSYPTAMVAAFASAARLGIMIKETRFLEDSANVDTIVMDKTGTITTGHFSVSRLVPADGVDGAELLRAAANGEQHSNHPLALAILSTARKARVEPDGTNDYEEVHGRGVRARTSMGEILVGRASWLRSERPEAADAIEKVERDTEGMTGVHVMLDGRYLGIVGLEDTVRKNTRSVIQRLRDLGVRRIAIFTGDRLSVGSRVGRAVGVDSVEAECLPEEKHELIGSMSKAGYRTMMVGDGINDGPSLAAADVGVAMGLAGSDIAANSAGVVLMNDDLARVPYTIELARRTRVIIGQNIAASMVIVVIGLVLAATGSLSVPLAALYHFLGDIFVIGNSFRLFRFGEGLAEGEEEQAGPAIPRREASVRGLTRAPAPA